MEVFQPEIHSGFFRPILDDAKETLGIAAVEEMLAPFNLRSEQLEDETAWVSLVFAEAFLSELAKAHGGPEFLNRCMRQLFTLRYGGALLPIFKAFGTPAFTYRQVATVSDRFQKIHTTEILCTRPGYVRLRLSRREGMPSIPNHLICYGTIAQLSAIPTMFGLPPARVAHSECICRGDRACIYDVEYQEPAKQYWSLLSFLLGSCLSASLLFIGDVPFWPVIALCIGLGLGAIGRLFELKRDVAHMVEDIANHNDALQRSARANEERFQEILEAKAQVDEKVEKRTAELRETSERLAQTLRQVQALSNAKAEFFANVSHDLRTPLTLLTAPLDDMIANREPPGGQRAAIESMHRSANRLLQLITQLLDMSKIDAGGVELRRKMIDLAELSRDIVQSFMPIARSKLIDLRVESNTNISPAPLDPVWLESILSNLLGNALRFVDEGGKVIVSVKDHGSELLLQVQDTGHGISSEDLPHVFERYTQAGGYRARRGGTGIGLALVREAARLHGGDVSVTSELNKGTTFSVRLPRVTAKIGSQRSFQFIHKPNDSRGPTIATLQSEIRQNVDDSERPGPLPDAPFILVVEDDVDTRRFIADILAVRYRVRVAANGREGLKLAKELHPDAIVTDIDMPEMDGFALCQRIRKQEQTKSTPIVLLTAMGDPKSIITGFDVGADDFVSKPFHGRELLARIEVHLRLRQMVSEMAHSARLAMLGVTAASIAHNVRNPLNAIMSGLETIGNRFKNQDPSTALMIKTMVECAERISQITTDLMNISRTDRAIQGKWRAATGLLACVRTISARLPQGVVLESDIDQDAVVEGRPGDLNHVFLNLLDNALHAVGNNGCIQLRVKQQDSNLMITVADSGKGVDPKLRERIFQPFVTTRSAGQGTGLGLSIAKQVIEQHGGTITVQESRQLGGAHFVVQIPIAESFPKKNSSPEMQTETRISKNGSILPRKTITKTGEEICKSQPSVESESSQ